MIRVSAIYKDNFIQSITISGHAQSNESGKDLVCAGVSAISTGICNELDHRGFLTGFGKITLKEGFIQIEVNQFRDDFNIILETLITSLKTVEESSKQYIKITEDK